jgi:hypothetical protein
LFAPSASPSWRLYVSIIILNCRCFRPATY